MKVSDLIEELQMMDENEDVGFSYNYGDHCQTMVVECVSEVRVLEIEYSEYHQMDKLVNEDYRDDKKDYKQIIVLT